VCVDRRQGKVDVVGHTRAVDEYACLIALAELAEI
jgi:hypothetical protein